MINTDSLTRKLYAQDASMYQELPQGVAFPKSTGEIRELVKQAAQDGFSITARSAGTSLAGQATGGGVIMDVSRFMTDILEINSEDRFARVQPGVIRDTLNREAAKHNLLFGPDTATTNRCMIGGMIGNNSAGSFSIKYKSTREHTIEVETVLSDGSVARFKALSDEELEERLKSESFEGDIYRSMIELLHKNKELIQKSYPHPEIIRRNTGYALDKLCEMKPINPNGRPFNMAELLCGSEGTLAMTTAAALNLEKLPQLAMMLVPQFSSLEEALEAANEAVKFQPAAVELVDDIILDATKGNIAQAKNRFFLDGKPKCILIIQFEGETRAELELKIKELTSVLRSGKLGYSFPALADPLKMSRVWELRKAGLGLLMGLGKESRTPAFCEDTSVRVEDLPEYIREFKTILKKYDTNCVFYAHASVGELHLRPMIDTTQPEEVAKMKQMAEEIAKLVKKYRGSLSGEHGDGRARAPFIQHVLGEEMMPVLREVKEIWDPKYIFNPGKIVAAKPMDQDLRFSPDYKPLQEATMFNWRREGSFNDALELCNGAGVCRKLSESGGTMCPSYMATKEEKDSTRGRANVFRQVFSGENPSAFESEELKSALELCLSCKACKTECPANVDMARMKSEFLHGWHQKKGLSFRDRFYGQPGRMYPLAAVLPGLSNWMMGTKAGKSILKKLAGVWPERTMPAFSSTTFMKWFKKHNALKSNEKVVLFIDLFTNYHDPENGIDSVSVMEAMGFEVIPVFHESARTLITMGLLDKANKKAESLIRIFSVHKDIPIVGIEPSAILTIRDEYLDLVSDEMLDQTRQVAARAFTFEEFIADNSSRLPSADQREKVLFHGHCHAKALIGNEASMAALVAAGYEVEVVDSGCCGMAGSFGYEHFDISMQIGEQRLFPAVREHPEHICAPGFSCRHQIREGTGRQAVHPAHLIANTLRAKN